jgi:hypothetical protein
VLLVRIDALVSPGIRLARRFQGNMRPLVRWGSVLAVFGGLAFWMRRSRQRKPIDPHSLGTMTSQWFVDRRYDL